MAGLWKRTGMILALLVAFTHCQRSLKHVHLRGRTVDWYNNMPVALPNINISAMKKLDELDLKEEKMNLGNFHGNFDGSFDIKTRAAASDHYFLQFASPVTPFLGFDEEVYIGKNGIKDFGTVYLSHVFYCRVTINFHPSDGSSLWIDDYEGHRIFDNSVDTIIYIKQSFHYDDYVATGHQFKINYMIRKPSSDMEYSLSGAFGNSDTANVTINY